MKSYHNGTRDYTAVSVDELKNIDRLVMNRNKEVSLNLVKRKGDTIVSLFPGEEDKVTDYIGTLGTKYSKDNLLGLYLRFMDIETAKVLHPEYSLWQVRSHINRFKTGKIAYNGNGKTSSLSDEVREHFRQQDRPIGHYVRPADGFTIKDARGRLEAACVGSRRPSADQDAIQDDVHHDSHTHS